jgi:hypothetical protein
MPPLLRPLLFLIFTTHVGFSASELRFDASKDKELPRNAQVFFHGPGASIEMSDKKLQITSGSGVNSARAAVALPPAAGSAACKSRELKLDFEPFTGKNNEGGRAGLWAGFVQANPTAQTIYSVKGDWLGVLVEVKEDFEGKYSVTLRERWKTDEANVAHLTSGVSSDSTFVRLCTLTGCPTELELKVEEDKIRVSFVGARIAELAPGALGIPAGNEVEKFLQREMVAILQGKLDAAFGLANYGELPQAPFLLLKRFSIKQ